MAFYIRQSNTTILIFKKNKKWRSEYSIYTNKKHTGTEKTSNTYYYVRSEVKNSKHRNLVLLSSINEEIIKYIWEIITKES